MLILLINVLPCNADDGFGCPTSLLMKDSDREKYLSYHNELRRNIAFGNATYSQDLKPIGPASNMYELAS
ncbi:unnamed protein product [Heligmosomoides polygyrus]|uniref:SCP domain-containing protein n=1 Tax=Heligmosomoides polygyrus TaxID=6339 RepID=A0A183GLG9_HELPZ|nr:unnamed protein product [Heligmosomoides polygyrus]